MKIMYPYMFLDHHPTPPRKTCCWFPVYMQDYSMHRIWSVFKSMQHVIQIVLSCVLFLVCIVYLEDSYISDINFSFFSTVAWHSVTYIYHTTFQQWYIDEHLRIFSSFANTHRLSMQPVHLSFCIYLHDMFTEIKVLCQSLCAL